MPSTTEAFDTLAALTPESPGAANYPSWVHCLACTSSFDQFCSTFRGILDPEQYCPSCANELARRGRAILADTGQTLLIANDYPRKDTEEMLLVVPKAHITDLADLDGAHFLDLHVLLQEAAANRGMTDGAIVSRYGRPLYHVGTVFHWHWNIIRPRPYEGMSIPLAKTADGPYGYDECHRRLLAFVQKLKERGGMSWLFSPEGIASLRTARS